MKFYEIESKEIDGTFNSRDFLEAMNKKSAIQEFNSLCLEETGTLLRIVNCREFSSEADYLDQI